MNANIGIFEANYYLPATKKALSQIFQDEEKPTEAFAADVDFEKDIGIEALHVAKNETAADLCINAAKLTMAKSGIDPKEIDLIIDFTSIPEDYVAPTWSAAGQVQKAIGATRAFATAVNTGGCVSYQTTLKVACSLMSANDRYNTALLVAGDKTPEFNHNYFPITVVSDGGSAVILKKNMTKRRILGVEVATVGRLHDMWFIPGIHNRKPEDIGASIHAGSMFAVT
jgi:3-oxoacyl-[acyl-carrier-protein] synthase-3